MYSLNLSKSGICPVRDVPGRSQDTNHSRHCGNEIETLAHVLDACPHGDMRSLIAQVFRERKFQVYEEVHGVSETGSNRRVDIIAIQPDPSSAIIIDPKIRWEINDDQPISVHKEKCCIYEPTIQYYRKKYHLTSIEVVGLMIGARGTIPDFFVKFCRRFKIHNAFIKKVALCTLKWSLLILINHLYGVQM